MLWAAGRAPFYGQYRTIYYKDSTGTYIYDPASHTLTFDSSSTTTNGFRITYNSEFDYDSGISYTFALSASVSLWTGTQSQLASCPQGNDIVFGIRSIPTGLTTQLVAVSSDQSLCDPTTNGSNMLEQVMARDMATHRFEPHRCLPQSGINSKYSRLEAGFTAGGMVLQAAALDLNANGKTGLSSGEQAALQFAAGIPADDIPVIVLAVGKKHVKMKSLHY